MAKVIVNKKRTEINVFLKKFFIFLLFIFIIFIISFSFFYFKKNNLISNYIEDFSIKYNYIIKEVEISGLKNVPEEEITSLFKKYYNKSIFLIPINKISNKIKKNKWIKDISINNNFKNKISVNIKEFEILAVYFNGINYLLINELGRVIDFAKEEDIDNFIILEGKNSPKEFLNLINYLPIEINSIISKVKYINNRRWDIYTLDNLVIQLPENDFEKAINTFHNIYKDLYSSDLSNIEKIDLRLPEKAIIKINNEKK